MDLFWTLIIYLHDFLIQQNTLLLYSYRHSGILRTDPVGRHEIDPAEDGGDATDRLEMGAGGDIEVRQRNGGTGEFTHPQYN